MRFGFFFFIIQIAYGRLSPNNKGYRDLDLFIQQKDGQKIVDPDKQSALCSRLKVEMLHPLRVIIANRGPDTELLVANPVELSGKGRPRVFYDVTLALKSLGICIFSVRIYTWHQKVSDSEIPLAHSTSMIFTIRLLNGIDSMNHGARLTIRHCIFSISLMSTLPCGGHHAWDS
jgi:hypothetical protein